MIPKVDDHNRDDDDDDEEDDDEESEIRHAGTETASIKTPGNNGIGSKIFDHNYIKTVHEKELAVATAAAPMEAPPRLLLEPPFNNGEGRDAGMVVFASSQRRKRLYRSRRECERGKR